MPSGQKCGFCREHGHNRTTCLKQHVSKVEELQKQVDSKKAELKLLADELAQAELTLAMVAKKDAALRESTLRGLKVKGDEYEDDCGFEKVDK